ncbi:MAG: hypothetical protein P8M28_09470 [Alphaproteobacteria bacterium]|nr:hypothetical protein [Alphaproteobacteria bacterium]
MQTDARAPARGPENRRERCAAAQNGQTEIGWKICTHQSLAGHALDHRTDIPPVTIRQRIVERLLSAFGIYHPVVTTMGKDWQALHKGRK